MRIPKVIRGKVRGNDSEAKAIQRHLKPLRGSTDGINCAAHGRLLQICADRCLLRQGLQLHARLVLFSVVPDNFLGSKLIAFYSKTQRLHLARHVFDQIPHPNTFSWNALIIASSAHADHAEVLKIFASMVLDRSVDVRPDNFTVTCLMKATNDLFSRPGLAKEVHAYVLRNGFLDSDVFVANSLVTCYARCCEIGLTRALFDRMPSRDVVSWNSMLAAYSQAGFYDECKALYKDMLGSAEVKPNYGTLVSVLQACGQSKDLDLGTEVHKYMTDNKIEADIFLYNALVGLYAKCGSFEYALELFDWMVTKDEITYTSLISGYMAHGLVDSAMEFFYRIRNPRIITWNSVITGLVHNNRHEKAVELVRGMMAYNHKPNFITLSNILTVISHFSHLKGVKEIHGYAYRSGHERNGHVSSGLINAYAKLGFLHSAQLTFDRSKMIKSVTVWTAMISAYANHGAGHKALRLYKEMIRYRIQPDRVTFVTVLTSCAHFGVVEEAKKIFESMCLRHGIEPSIEHYTCMVTVLSKAGRLSEAVNFITSMPMEPGAKIWGALLGGASAACNVEVGELACERLFKIEPENTGNYVVMANLYTEAERYKEANAVREKMNRIGLKKVPGSSQVIWSS